MNNSAEEDIVTVLKDYGKETTKRLQTPFGKHWQAVPSRKPSSAFKYPNLALDHHKELSIGRVFRSLASRPFKIMFV